MKLSVQHFLEMKSLADLKADLGIEAREYDDIVVLNYGLKSPKFNPVCDECRALILEKGTWRVLARAMDRFYNAAEGNGGEKFPFAEADCQEKLDGSILLAWHYKGKWNVSTRSMAYAEGPMSMGIGTFRDLWDRAVRGYPNFDHSALDKGRTYFFELTSPENRIVTRYQAIELSLIGARSLLTGDEDSGRDLDALAAKFGLRRPRSFSFRTMTEVAEAAKALDPLDEGFVAVVEGKGSFRRIKIKNPAYLAIAHLVDNGKVSAKRILSLVLSQGADEFIGYFPEHKKYVDFVREEWSAFLTAVMTVWTGAERIESQKEFALTIMSRTKSGLAHGVLFQMRKGRPFEEAIKMEPTKAFKGLDLKRKFEAKFNVVSEDEEEG